MAATPESKVKKAIKKTLEESGAYYVTPQTGGFGRSGMHDFIVCHKGYFISIEAKSDETKMPTALQDMHAKEVVEAGGSVLLIHKNNVHVLEHLLDAVVKHANLVQTTLQFIEWPEGLEERVRVDD